MKEKKAVDHCAVVRLLGQGFSKQQIAAKAHTSPRTVRRIELGIHKLPQRHQRCPGCGGKQIMPCQVCEIRSAPAAA